MLKTHSQKVLKFKENKVVSSKDCPYTREKKHVSHSIFIGLSAQVFGWVYSSFFILFFHLLFL